VLEIFVFIKTEDIGLKGLDCEEPIGRGIINEWLGTDSIYTSGGDGLAVFSAERTESGYLIRGNLAVTLATECSRCLKELEMDIKAPFSALYTERRPFSKGDDETDGESDQLFFSGPVLELDDIIRDSLLLSLQMAPKCSEECKGLCPGCGVNLNDEICLCKSKTIH